MARKAERKTKEVVQPWNSSEVGSFVAAMKGDRLFAPLLPLMGLRPAEACGLRWSDIDLDAATLSIANTRTLRRREPARHRVPLHRIHQLGRPRHVRIVRQGSAHRSSSERGRVPLTQPGRQGHVPRRRLHRPARGAPHEYPLQLTTGRTCYRFHTRTKTACAPELQKAASDVWVEISPADARAHGLNEGVLAEVATLRGSATWATASSSSLSTTATGTPAGHRPEGGGRAANEATITDWGPVSKQPIYKTCAARISLIERGNGRLAPAPTVTASAPVATDGTTPTTGGPSAHATETVVDAGGRQ
ncbi:MULTISPECIES: molybdopterin dinucleotide binding domain-containing protein [unclassified Streptomyces]|uniref:molybdopterin dinucleotide binding domain-containing protein n=2 Tax=Streptomyces TaxID=1883 RepID=UPI0027954BC2|nr:molybdopterin dinucleotide binding domain-containing protein [Streptomyces sp. alain-838]